MFFPEVRERFRREIESVARLSHQGIVAIHTVGEQNGVPFFAMEIVAGVTLQQLVQELHGHDPRTLSARHVALVLEAHGHGPLADGDAERVFGRSWVEVTFRIALQAARALQHAHERDVLHRDIKPSNLMLTREGRVVLLDFGLASMEGQSRLTQAGVEIGSLAYQAPEVVGGGPRSGNRRRRLRARRDAVRAADAAFSVPRPDRVPDARERARRRAAAHSAAEPFGTLGRGDGLHGRPRPRAGPALRERGGARGRPGRMPRAAADRGTAGRARPAAKRWAQRNAAWAVGIGLLLLALVFVPTGIAILEHQASARIAEQSRRADVERKRAERNLRNARLAVDRMLATVGQRALHEVPQMEPIRKKLLEEARDFYEHFLRENHDSKELRRDVAMTTQGLGSLLRKLGQAEKSQEALGRAVALAEQLVGEEPSSLPARRDLWNCWNELGVTARERGDHELAAKAWSHARDAMVPVAAASPDDPRFLSDLCDCVQNLASLHALDGAYDEAERELLAVLGVRTRIRELAPNQRYPLSELAGLSNNLGFICEKRPPVRAGGALLRARGGAAAGGDRDRGLDRPARGPRPVAAQRRADPEGQQARAGRGRVHGGDRAAGAYLQRVPAHAREPPRPRGLARLPRRDLLTPRPGGRARALRARAARREKADVIASSPRSQRLKQTFGGMLAKLQGQGGK
jgi:tetratricopeptide (TPR) repeat protein